MFIPHALDGMIPSIRVLRNIEELEEERRVWVDTVVLNVIIHALGTRIINAQVVNR